MEMIKIYAVRSDGQLFNYESEDWGVNAVTGLEFPEVEVFSANKGLGDGEIITGKRKAGRRIEITAKMRGFGSYSDFRMKKDRLIGFHNARYSFDLYVTLMGVTRVVKDCQITSGNFQQIQVSDKIPFLTVSFLSPHAELYGTDEIENSFVEIVPLWHVDRVYEYGGGSNAFGILGFQSEHVVRYYGTEPAPIIVEVNASGTVTGLTITCNDIACNLDEELALNDGDQLLFDCDAKRIRLNGELISAKNTPISIMDEMKLSYGENRICVSAADGNDCINAVIRYLGQYGGI